MNKEYPLHLDYQQADSVDRTFPSLSAELAGNPHLLINILDTIYDRVFLKDTDGKLVFGNQAFLNAFGLTAKQVVGKLPCDFLPDLMIDRCEVADRSVLLQGVATCLETSWVDPKTGQQRWSETHKSPLRDAAGKITGLVGVSRDVTSRRQTEEELNRQKTLLELIIETVPDWIFVKDRDRKVVLGNRAFYEQQGLEPNTVVGADPTLSLPKDSREISRQSDTFVLETGQATSGELTVLDPQGVERYLEYRKLPLVADGKITGIVGVSRDLTERKEAEEQARRNEALLLHASRLSSLGELSAGIAHEVNQPLYTILNYAKAVENKLNSSEGVDLASVREWVSQIRKEAERGGQITRRLKSFSKPADTQREPASVNTIVLESIGFIRTEARDAGVVVDTDFDGKLPDMALDRIQIQQVLLNLLKNAIEACLECETTTPRVLVSTKLTTEGAEILVEDNGPGVAVNKGVNILDPFQTTKHDGVGLGLAISNTIVQSHDGRITYDTNQWGGATFCVSLPNQK